MFNMFSKISRNVKITTYRGERNNEEIYRNWSEIQKIYIHNETANKTEK